MLLKAQDPATGVIVPPARTPVVALIARAETTRDEAIVGRPPRPTRRLLLATAAAAVVTAVATGAVLSVYGPENRPTGVDQVLVPVAYQITTRPPAAGDHLRALAAQVTAAPYDTRTGRYSYVHTQVWGDPIQTSEDGRYAMSYVMKWQNWTAADGSGHQRTETVEAMYPDERSAAHFVNAESNIGEPSEGSIPPGRLEVRPLPTDRRALAEFLRTTEEPAVVARTVSGVYSRSPVSRASRAMILDVLADVPGFYWRGNVTDRAGRPGVAITGSDPEHDLESLLIFDPTTGALLAYETINLEQHPKLNFYKVFLDYDRTDTVD